MACIRGITENSQGGVRMKILLTGAAGQLGQALRQGRLKVSHKGDCGAL